MNGHCDKTSRSGTIRSMLRLNTLKSILVKITLSISDASSRNFFIKINLYNGQFYHRIFFSACIYGIIKV